jgi:hypothetical protein
MTIQRPAEPVQPKDDAPADAPELWRWQSRLLPLLIGLLIAFTAVFCISNLYQIFTVQDYIRKAPTLDAHTILAPEARASDPRLGVLADLESYALVRRYHQANIVVMGRLYVVYLGFTTGMILALVGAAFILSKYREAPSTVEGSGLGNRLAIGSTSPGLVLATLGTLLMIITMTTRADVMVGDASVYMSSAGPGPVPTSFTDNLKEAAKHVAKSDQSR